MERLRFLHNQTSILTKVLAANALVMGVGSLAAILLAARLWEAKGPSPFLATLLMIAGLAGSLVISYVVLRLAFAPLYTLQSGLDRVRQGDFSARVPPISGDPEVSRIGEIANLMLDRLTEHRQAVAAQVLKALEDERKRISRELHDETSQSLTSILVHLEVLEQQFAGENEGAAAQLHLTKEIAQRTLDETRRLMYDLRPSVLDDLGLVPALRWFISRRVQPLGLAVNFQASGLDQRLPDDHETALFRIMQEAITNALKHARARNLTVTLARSGGQIIGEVADDGVGFHPVRVVSKHGKERGLGLFGMQERAALVGGAIHIDSTPGRGTTVRVTVPDRLMGEAR